MVTVWRCIVFSLVFAATAASAGESGEAPTRGRASLTAGFAWRANTQSDGSFTTSFGGNAAPTVLVGSGAYFFKPYLGVALDASADIFAIRGTSLAGQAINTRAFGFQVLPALVGRLTPKQWLSVELHLGWDFTGWPAIDVRQADVPAALLFRSGLAVAAVLDFAPESVVHGRITLGGSPFSVTASLFDQAMASNWVGVNAQLGVGRLRIGDLLGAIVLCYSTAYGRAASDGYEVTNLEHRLSLGVSARWLTKVDRDNGPAWGTGRLAGVVVSGDGQPVAAAKVELLGHSPAITDAAGHFAFADVAVGPVSLTATADGFKAATSDGAVRAGVETNLRLTLLRPSGPGSIRGLVKSKDGGAPLIGAEVVVDDAVLATTAADGSFALPSVGPGPVQVVVRLRGYQTADEVVQVPAEGLAQLSLTLAKAQDRLPATLRGLIRAVGAAKAPKVTVRVIELKSKVAVKADGRFVLQVPGGTYTIAIDAPGYVAQTKSVQVADGDQAIFHVELQPVPR